MGTRPSLRYALSVADPVRRLLAVTLEVRGTEPGAPLVLRMPAWTPGSYLVREYARHVEGVAARSAGKRRLPVQRVAKDRWEVRTPASRGPVTVSWRVYANELSVRTNHADDTHAFVQPTATFLCPERMEGAPLRLEVHPPDGWTVACSLPRIRAPRAGTARFEAPDQETLHDSPVHMGRLRHLEFRVRRVPHELVLWGEGNEDAGRIARDLEALVNAAARLFGGLPYDRYLVHGLLGEAGGGGLEHREGFVFQAPRWGFRPEKAYARVQNLLAHELFHAWNVRRIRPAGLLPYDLSAEKYTRLLWQFEGVTSYYADLLCRRAGLWTRDATLRHLAGKLGQLAATPGRRAMSMAESSLATWVKLYRPDEHTANSAVSYYLKGELAGLALDLFVRAATGGKRSYDDAMRLLWERHGATGAPVPEDGMAALLEEATGVDCRRLHDRLVERTGDPPWEKLLRPFGVRVVCRATDPPEGYENGAWLGAETEERGGRTVLKSVRSDGPAAGSLAAGDELVALDGLRAGGESLPKRLAERRPGATVRFTVLRGDRLLEVPVRLGAPPPERFALEVDPKAPAAARRLREGWLGKPAPAGR